MTSPLTLFEVSFEVCNKVGGIHTVVSTKAKALVERLGDDYVAIGPWLLTGGHPSNAFEEEPDDAFCERCRAMGIPVRVGRWKIPGRPRTLLVEFSGAYAQKDAILRELWDGFQVDSIEGQWDYVEPVLFGWAAGQVIQAWCEERVAPRGRRAVAQFHEWMTGAGGLWLQKHDPSVGTIFTTHATILGRSIASTGKAPVDGLGARTPSEASRIFGVVAKHSMEVVCAREADAFTTVSGVTRDEAEVLLGRRADPILPNGIDLAVVDELAGKTTRDEARAKLVELAGRMVGADVSDAVLVGTSGRYEFHNKGLDILLDSAALITKRPGKRVVLIALVPAGNSGIRGDLHERSNRPASEAQGPIGIATHNLFDVEHDPIARRCLELGLANAAGSRVFVIHVPIYLAEGDGLFGMPYEAVLRALDLTVFPSFYEPWGYTPQESLAVGVPTITTDCAGFGRWARDARLGMGDGVVVLDREEAARNGDESALPERLAGVIESFLAESRDRGAVEAACRATARLTSWSDLLRHYDAAFEIARRAAEHRVPATRSTTAFQMKKSVEVAPPQHGHRARLTPFRVAATLPEALRGLERLARNLWWSWDAEATALFAELSPARWVKHGHNPITFLRDVYTEDLARMAADASYVARVKATAKRFDAHLAEPQKSLECGGAPALSPYHPVAYFSAEFGVHESLRVYSGGLGILAGDHLKSASDIGLPLIGIGLFYRMGYFAQGLTPAGDQIVNDRENDPRDLPLELVRDAHGEPVEVELQLPSSTLVLHAWKANVGRVPLYLLDANVPANRPEDREITRQLYGGDHETRLRQEIVLGRGGKRLLQKLGINPACFHINEGHAAFLVLERVSRLVKEVGLTFDEAREFVRASTVFTTHTPVPAGHDRFGEDMMRRYFADVSSWVGVPWERFWALGSSEEDRTSFNMTYLAMSFAGFVNGVSRLHGEVSKSLLKPFWPRLLAAEVPVTSITNGVHLASWTHPDMCVLLGVKDRAVRGDDFARGAQSLDDARLWEMRKRAKSRLVSALRRDIQAAFLARSDSAKTLSRTLDGLDENALWIGFARRFAPYKRAQLLLREPERLADLLDRPGRPVRLVFAGKAHPADKHGQEILKKIVEATRSERFLGKVFFVENYDIGLARTLVQGVDVWLNNPTRPLEASGTSGMKVAANGGLNVSIQDGWWIEAQELDARNGWSIGAGQVYPTQELQDDLDGEILHRLLDEDVIPLWFDRKNGIPHGWFERVRANLATIPPVFDTDRMVGEYRDRAYLPLGAGWHALRESRFAPTRARSERAQRIRKGFETVKIVAAQIADLSVVHEGDPIDVRVEADLGSLRPADVVVELVLGHSDDGLDLKNAVPIELRHVGAAGANARIFEGSHVTQRSGSYAWAIRIRARDGGIHDLSTRDLVLWG